MRLLQAIHTNDSAQTSIHDTGKLSRVSTPTRMTKRIRKMAVTESTAPLG